MCGIVGFIDFTNRSSITDLNNMIGMLSHRGPNDSGTQLIETKACKIGLAHKRLAIIDLSDSGKQPMCFKNLTLVLNGEIYNYIEIKNELISLGHSFIGTSDTEVLIHAFFQWGVDCVSKLNGMFAFVVYDSISQNIFLVRDRAGVKPLFYYYHNDVFLFGSELKALIKHPRFDKEINYDSLAAFFQFGNVPSPGSIFKNTFKLKAGHYIRIDGLNKDLEQKQYWNVYDFYNKPKVNLGFQDAKANLKELLESSSQFRMRADVPVGIFLSGGYDSTSLLALLNGKTAYPIKTFTISVPDLGLNEGEHAKRIAEHFGTEHHEIECKETDILKLFETYSFYFDEPFADSSSFPSLLLCKYASDHVKVALSADGGDELFAGYNRYNIAQRLSKTIKRLPEIGQKSLAYVMNSNLANEIAKLTLKNNRYKYLKLSSVVNDPSPKNILRNLTYEFTDIQLHELMVHKFNFPHTLYDSMELTNENSSILSYMMAIDYQTYLTDDIMQKVDRASMAASIEAREPLLDHRLIEFMATLPDEFKLNNKTQKYILKELVHQYIPKELMNRPKMGFAIPIAKWLKSELKERVYHYLNESRIKQQGVLNYKVTNQILNDFYSGKSTNHLKLWYLFIFQMWYQEWMDQSV